MKEKPKNNSAKCLSFWSEEVFAYKDHITTLWSVV